MVTPVIPVDLDTLQELRKPCDEWKLRHLLQRLVDAPCRLYNEHPAPQCSS